MAGASSLLTNRIFGVVLDAAKVAVAAWGAIWIEPWTAETFPTLGEPVHFLISAVIAALVLEIVLQLIFGWPRIKIAWSEKGSDVPMSEIQAKFRRTNATSQVFCLKLSTPPAGWLGYQVLRFYMLAGVQLQIRIDHAAIKPICETYSKRDEVPTVIADNSSHGVIVDLGRAPKRPGSWHYADVRWTDEGTPANDEFNVDYVFHHKNPIVKFLLNRLIWRSKNARHFRSVGT